eukprot:2364728-Amphidinium_carterae.1
MGTGIPVGPVLYETEEDRVKRQYAQYLKVDYTPTTSKQQVDLCTYSLASSIFQFVSFRAAHIMCLLGPFEATHSAGNKMSLNQADLKSVSYVVADLLGAFKWGIGLPLDGIFTLNCFCGEGRTAQAVKGSSRAQAA